MVLDIMDLSDRESTRVSESKVTLWIRAILPSLVVYVVGYSLSGNLVQFSGTPDGLSVGNVRDGSA